MDWREVAEEIYDKVTRALDYWCWNVSGDTALDCYCAHQDRDFYSLAEEFCGWSRFKITEKDLELLQSMPDDIYEEYNNKLQEAIEKVVDKLSQEVV